MYKESVELYSAPSLAHELNAPATVRRGSEGISGDSAPKGNAVSVRRGGVSASRPSQLEFRIATEDWEFEQIHALNYRTFVEEIPQHAVNRDKSLVDRFHRDNTYFVCVRERHVLGMVCVRDKRPFSLDYKLDDLNAYLPPHQSVCEVRLLSVEPKYRRGHVLNGLLNALARYAVEKGYDLAVMSGLEAQQKLYRHLGWIPFGPKVGTPGARYQPMYLTLEAYATHAREALGKETQAQGSHAQTHLLPGPVNMGARVRKAMARVPVSHRSDAFMDEFQLAKQRLCHLTGARSVEVFMSSGTLANDVVGGQLSLLGGRGVVLCNGEFGRRLVNHAKGWRLNFSVFEAPWGGIFNAKQIEEHLDRENDVAWLWAVHGETSTGVLNDLGALARICKRRSIRLCMDCVSSLGNVPLDLREVFLATGVSGKGLCAPCGLSMVFHNHQVNAAPDRLPPCLDLGCFAEHRGVPFTISSNLVHALSAALDLLDVEEKNRRATRLSKRLRKRLETSGFAVVGPEKHSFPAIVTVAVPRAFETAALGRRLEEGGFLVNFNTGYLLERNWIQVALMGPVSWHQLERFCANLESLCRPA
ncbi:MAG: aminotransferase class V-fold PLP-dependent enzyme [Candidatus Hydrogenedentes bacterium]|nr:aminotransferase class V-fold PLP-dependent enzyme [Candidatus Hydrogenedentota bacterium]